MVELGGAMLQRVTNLGGTPDGSISRTSRHQQSNAMSMVLELPISIQAGIAQKYHTRTKR
jgi:hypothetical protein